MALHIVISASLAWIINIWADESCTLYSTDGSLAFVCEKALTFEWQPPAYHVALSLWRKVHGSPFVARCFSILCTSITILAIADACRILGVKRPIFPAALFAFHPFAIYLATEIRPYGFATMIAALLLWTMLPAYWLTSNDRKSWPNTLAAGLALYTNILLGIPLAAQSVCVVLFRRGLWSRFVLRMLLVLVVAAPVLWHLLSVARTTELLPEDNTPANLASYLLGSLQYIVFPLPRMEATMLARGILLVLLLGLAALVAVRQRTKLTEVHALIGCYVAVCYLFLAGFIYATHLARTERYTYVLIPATIVAWALLWELATSERLKSSVYALSFLLCAGSLVVVYQPLCKTGDWIRVAEYLRTTAQPRQPIVVFPSEVHSLLKYYYTGENPLVPVPGPQRFDRFRMSDFRIPDRATIDRVLHDLLQPADGLILVTADPAIYRVEVEDPLNFKLLEDYLAEDFREVGRRQFLDTTVRTYKRRYH